MKPFPAREDLLLAIVAIAAGLLLFSSLDRLWPLADLDLNYPHQRLEEQARAFLTEEGFDLEGYRSASILSLDAAALDYVEREFGRGRVQEWIREGFPLYRYRVYFKRPGEIVYYRVASHPSSGVLGWTRHVEEDEPGARLPTEEARQLGERVVGRALDLDLSNWEEKAVSTAARPERTDHYFTFERRLSEDPELRERLLVSVAGDQVITAQRTLVVPREAARQARADEAPVRAMQTIGFALVAAFAVGAFFVFLTRLRAGSVRLGRAVLWVGVVLFCLICTYLLQTAILFLNWEPLWPEWISTLQYLVYRAQGEFWLLLVLLAVVAAGDALDRELGAGRGNSLWTLGRGRLLEPRVGAASLRGFFVGLLCGAVMVASLLVLEQFVEARTPIQPRGFFFYAINSASPTASTLLFFLNVALVEELAYRFFGGTWLLSLTGRAWIAVLIPGVLYGLTHTGLDFLPPAEPFWGRAIVMTLVGCVWGWAFLRYDALTVVLSHYTADLFIFNWPRLASGEPGPTTAALLTIAVPLLPALLWLVKKAVAPR